MTAPNPVLSPTERRKPARWVLLWAATAVLLLAVLGAGMAACITLPVRDARPLAERFPANLPGWRVEKRAVGATESIESATVAALQYDEAEVRIYTRGNVQIEVYVARWNPGKVNIGVPAGHLPDKCWIVSGWTKLAGETLELGGETWAWRRFQARQNTLETIYAHTAGGLPLPYNPLGRPEYPRLLARLVKRPLALRGEQVFVRFSSATPVADWWSVPGFPELYREISRILGVSPG